MEPRDAINILVGGVKILIARMSKTLVPQELLGGCLESVNGNRHSITCSTDGNVVRNGNGL